MATTVAVATMKVAQISEPGAGFEIVEREIPEPGAVSGEVLHVDGGAHTGRW